MELPFPSKEDETLDCDPFEIRPSFSEKQFGCALYTLLALSFSVHSSQGTVVKLATPLLLFGADLRLIFRETGRLLQVMSSKNCT